MNRTKKLVNPFQFTIAGIKLILFFFLPIAVIRIPEYGNVFQLWINDVYALCHPGCILPLFLYGLMIAFAFWPFHAGSMIYSIVVMIVELFLIMYFQWLIPAKEMMSASVLLVDKINPYLISFSDIESAIIHFLSDTFPEYEKLYLIIRNCVEYFFQIFPQYLGEAQRVISNIMQFVTDFWGMLIQILQTVFKPDIGLVINMLLTPIYGLSEFLISFRTTRAGYGM